MINNLAYSHKEDWRETLTDGQLLIHFLKTKADEEIVTKKSGEKGSEGAVTRRDPSCTYVQVPGRIPWRLWTQRHFGGWEWDVGESTKKWAQANPFLLFEDRTANRQMFTPQAKKAKESSLKQLNKLSEKKQGSQWGLEPQSNASWAPAAWLVSILLKLEWNFPDEGLRLQTQSSWLCHFSILFYFGFFLRVFKNKLYFLHHF